MTFELLGANHHEVLSHPLDAAHTVMLIARHSDRRYAVLTIDNDMEVAEVENFRAKEPSIMCSSLKSKGLEEVLDWVDRPTALARYSKLAGSDLQQGHQRGILKMHAFEETDLVGATYP